MKTSRRDFLTAAALAAPAVFAESGTELGASASAGPLKVCVFSDLHYHPKVWTNTEDTSFLEKILRKAFPKTVRGENLAGLVLWIIVCVLSFGVPFALLLLCRRVGWWLEQPWSGRWI